MRQYGGSKLHAETHIETEFGFHPSVILDGNFEPFGLMAVEASPVSLGGLCELEDHGQRGPVREAALAPHSAVTHRCERALDDVGRAQMLPVFSREVRRTPAALKQRRH